MLMVYHSNRLESPADQCAELLHQPLASPFIPEIIVVQNLGMARWLSLHLAQRLRVWAHIRFPFPAAIIWEVFQRLLTDVPDTSAFIPPMSSPGESWRSLDAWRVPHNSHPSVPILKMLRNVSPRGRKA